MMDNGSLVTCIVSQSYGGHSGGETPGPIPNPEAKPSSADGTALDRVWESRTPPNTHSRKPPTTTGWGFSAPHTTHTTRGTTIRAPGIESSRLPTRAPRPSHPGDTDARAIATPHDTNPRASDERARIRGPEDRIERTRNARTRAPRPPHHLRRTLDPHPAAQTRAESSDARTIATPHGTNPRASDERARIRGPGDRIERTRNARTRAPRPSLHLRGTSRPSPRGTDARGIVRRAQHRHPTRHQSARVRRTRAHSRPRGSNRADSQRAHPSPSAITPPARNLSTLTPRHRCARNRQTRAQSPPHTTPIRAHPTNARALAPGLEAGRPGPGTPGPHCPARNPSTLTPPAQTRAESSDARTIATPHDTIPRASDKRARFCARSRATQHTNLIDHHTQETMLARRPLIASYTTADRLEVRESDQDAGWRSECSAGQQDWVRAFGCFGPRI